MELDKVLQIASSTAKHIAQENLSLCCHSEGAKWYRILNIQSLILISCYIHVNKSLDQVRYSSGSFSESQILSSCSL